MQTDLSCAVVPFVHVHNAKPFKPDMARYGTERSDMHKRCTERRRTDPTDKICFLSVGPIRRFVTGALPSTISLQV